MKQYGEYLRELREARGLSIEQVSEDTKIVTEIIEALESMNKEKMASRVHLVGFIKLYTKYLGGDVEKVLALFKSTAVSETPIQFDVINISKKKQHAKPKRKISPAFFIVPIFIALCGAGLWWAYPQIHSFITQQAKEQSGQNESITTIKNIYENTFTLKENILLIKGNTQATAVVSSISPPIISIDNTKYTLKENEPISITLSHDVEYIVILREINIARRSLLLRFDPRTANPRIPQVQETAIVTETHDAIKTALQNADGQAFEILSSTTTSPIQMHVTAKISEAAYYYYEDSDELLEGFVTQPIVKNISQTQHMDLYISNAVAVTLKVNDATVPLPAKSLPIVMRIGWRTLGPNEHVLLAIPLP